MFYAVGEGTEFCLDTTRTASDGEMPVVAIDPSGNRQEVASDLGGAFLLLVQEELDLDGDD